MLWDKNSRRLLVHKPNWKCGQANSEFVTDFSLAISEPSLPNATRLADDLCKTIKMGFAFGLKENDVDSLPVTKNLELVPVDASST